jgi:hypothetical protein
VLSDELREFARAPGAFLEWSPAVEIVDTSRYFAVLVAAGTFVNGCLLRYAPDEAVARGTPALVVQAGSMSRPILERCGFERVCTMYEVEHDPS